MADKVNKEESIARVYQFLNTYNGDWKTDADTNGNGRIIKTEFRTFLLGANFKWVNGENKEDIIDAFWKSIDTKTTGKITGSRTSNKNALDADEIENVERSIQATQKVEDFMKDKSAPNELDSQYKTAWKNSVKQGLIYKATELMKKGSVEDITEEWLENAYKLSSAKATADYTATGVINKELGNVKDYAVGDDKTLKGIVDDYVSKLENNPKDDATIISEIKELVKAYVDTAKTNSSNSVALLSEYGYDPDYYLNDLQVSVLTNEITEKILNYLKTNRTDIYTDEYKQQIEQIVKQYVEKYLSDKSANEFNSLKNFDALEFTSSSEYLDLISEINAKQEALRTARANINTIVAQIIAEKDTDKNKILQEVLGSTNATDIMNKLLSIKTTAELESLYNKLQDKLSALEATRAAEEQAKEAQYKASFGNLATHLDQILNDNKSAMTKSISSIHTEFGMDEKGNIVFEQNETSEVYKAVVKTLTKELQAKDKEAFNAIGEDNIKKLIQAAWISTYNTFKSSESNSTSRFVDEVVNQFKKILNKLTENPDYLKLYTSHSAYANSSLTSNLSTYGNNTVLNYSGFKSILSDGGVEWDGGADSGDCYYETMKKLLTNIKNSNTYKGIDESVLTSVFREAQEEALNTCTNNINDCPYGTTNTIDLTIRMFGANIDYSAAKGNSDWAGTNRHGDRSKITVDALVQMTLYYFDKLLYAQIAG